MGRNGSGIAPRCSCAVVKSWISGTLWEISEGVVLDYDADGKLVGIDIDNAGAKVDIRRLTISKLPAPVETVPG